jgi:outer membrane lipoprotein-sorting protein
MKRYQPFKFEENQNIKSALEDYIKKIQEVSDEHFKKDLPNTWERQGQSRFTYKEGGKFYKIIQGESEDVYKTKRGSVWAFIDKETGDIYKAASANAPAKGVRGNVLDPKAPLTYAALYKRL